ncbi:MAG TPA: HD domain-containing protein [Anaerolineales bacterium]|nr:HD domain-containing protein [Anaerolineales bacterium]
MQNFEKAKQYALQRLETELSSGLFYHDLMHTTNDVVPATEKLAKGEGIKGESLDLLLTAAWFHDLGFIEGRAGHEAMGARIASEVLPGLGFRNEQIQTIRNLIIATVLPQSPQTILDQIMADADLDVLGRDDFMLRNGNLRRELAAFGQEFTDLQWFSDQLRFLETHAYFTASARALRDAGKAKNVAALKKKLEEIK